MVEQDQKGNNAENTGGEHFLVPRLKHLVDSVKNPVLRLLLSQVAENVNAKFADSEFDQIRARSILMLIGPALGLNIDKGSADKIESLIYDSEIIKGRFVTESNRVYRVFKVEEVLAFAAFLDTKKTITTRWSNREAWAKTIDMLGEDTKLAKTLQNPETSQERKQERQQSKKNMEQQLKMEIGGEESGIAKIDGFIEEMLGILEQTDRRKIQRVINELGNDKFLYSSILSTQALKEVISPLEIDCIIGIYLNQNHIRYLSTEGQKWQLGNITYTRFYQSIQVISQLFELHPDASNLRVLKDKLGVNLSLQLMRFIEPAPSDISKT